MSLGHYAYGGIQNSYSFPFPGIGGLSPKTTPTQMPNIPCEQVVFQNHPDSTGYLYIGTDAAMGHHTSIVLPPGQFSPFFPIQNIGTLYYECADATTYPLYMMFK